MRILAITLAFLLICSCAHVEPNSAPGPKTVVQSLFVDRLSKPRTFNFFTFWNLPAVEDSFDAPLRKAFDDFKATCKEVYPDWGKWGNGSEAISSVFSVYARNDPLTMVSIGCSQSKR